MSDLTAVSLPAEASAHYWGAQAPVRLLFFFALLGYTYLFKPGGVLAAATAAATAVGKGDVGGWADGLQNSVVFTWAFLEMMCWFWVSCSCWLVEGGWWEGGCKGEMADGWRVGLCYVEG